MTLEKTLLNDVFIINNFNVNDERGSFVKTFNKNVFNELNLNFEIRESYFSSSKSKVIRGMHFQLPPDDHAKIVYCSSGKLLDVILDLRKDSPSYGDFTTVELSSDNFKGVYLPKGTAHGFCTLEDNTCMVYLTSTVHSPKNDGGVLFDSFGFSWPIAAPINSGRDLTFPSFKDFNSPF